MAKSPARPRVPAGLEEAGKALWRRITGDVLPGYALDERELHLLEQACILADEIAGLDARVVTDGPVARGSRGQPVVHPAIQEARLLRVVQLRLLSALDLGEEAA